MNEGTPEVLLELAGVDIPGAERRPLFEGLDLTVGAGELVLVLVGRGAATRPLGDTVVGLSPPPHGEVRFLGRTWAERSPLEAAAARHGIGRVYDGTEWVSNLDVDENVILACCHHTRRPEPEIVDEALELAQHFGLSDLAAVRPDRVDPAELRAYALVRALLGEPRLLLLERPLRGVVHALSEPLLTAIASFRGRGGGVLWLTAEEGLYRSDATPADLRYVLDGRRLRADGGDRS